MTKKMAAIEISVEAIPAAVQVLIDSGLTIEGSMYSGLDHRKIVLVVSGESLPDECAGPLQYVVAEITSEAYGSQKIHRVSSLKAVGDYFGGVQPC